MGRRSIPANACFMVMTLVFFFSGCAREPYYIRGPDGVERRIVALPGGEQKTTFYTINGERYYPLPKADGFVQYGKASWYGGEFHGRFTASGEKYDMNKKTAAHKTLPMGTYVKVLNLSNKKQSVVRINDRGPFVKGRIIDLSRAVAEEIDLIGPGVVDVKIVALGKEVGELGSGKGSIPLVELADLKTGAFTIQIGAFSDKNNALEVANRLGRIFDYIHVAVQRVNGDNALYKVHVSKSETLSKAGRVEKRLQEMGFTEAFVVRI
ncbi:MAG: septal ring lytic transglycosylase RlpA family protein [Deltaproteobacteria bacterium]|nr:septal ring lytic transglycosylase RlpA family protein [Deltaproteobacteria bacterium]